MANTAAKPKPMCWALLYKLALLGTVLCILVLFFTGFSPVVTGTRLSGYLLMMHAACAPVFICCVAFLALVESEQRVLLAGENLMHGVGKVCFWLLLCLSLPLTLSIVLSMFPLLGTHGQEILFQLHRSTAIVFSCVAAIQTCVLLKNRF